MDEKKMAITVADVQDVREILDSLALLPPPNADNIEHTVYFCELCFRNCHRSQWRAKQKIPTAV